MALYLDGKIHFVGALTEPSSYDADITPENMQRGMTAYAQGKKVVGTGKAFEFAEYGSKVATNITDSNGVKRYGFKLDVGANANVVFVAPSKTGDIVLQNKFLVTITEGEEIVIADNYSAGGELRAYYDERLIVYLTEYTGKPTILHYFVGKDNAI
jgi:hypothetical protein